MKRITITIDVPDEAYTPQYVQGLQWHVLPCRLEDFTTPSGYTLVDLLAMVSHHAHAGHVEVSYR